MNVVPLKKPEAAAEIAAKLQELSERAAAGEFEAVYYVFTTPSGAWLSGQAGPGNDPLRMIGILESMKADILDRASDAAAS